MPIPDHDDGRVGRGPWITAPELQAALDEVSTRLGPDFELHKSANQTGNLLFASGDRDARIEGMIDLCSAEVTWW